MSIPSNLYYWRNRMLISPKKSFFPLEFTALNPTLYAVIKDNYPQVISL